jgi:hypothetical protein
MVKEMKCSTCLEEIEVHKPILSQSVALTAEMMSAAVRRIFPMGNTPFYDIIEFSEVVVSSKLLGDTEDISLTEMHLSNLDDEEAGESYYWCEPLAQWKEISFPVIDLSTSSWRQKEK